MIKNNVVVAIIEKSRGNESVGDMWLETKIFDKNEPVESIMDWAKKRGVTGKIILTIPEGGGCVMTNKLSLKEQLLAVAETIEEPRVLVVAVELPTGAIEIITNTSNIDSKLEYYTTMYDDAFRLRANPKVRIIGAMIV